MDIIGESKMSERNKKIIDEFFAKASIGVGSGGQLSAEAADFFISTVIAQNEILSKVQTYRMTAATRNIDVIGVEPRQMRAITAGVEPAATADATFPRRLLTTKGVMLPYNVNYDFFEENIEGASAEEALNRAFGTQFANDIVDLMLNGDEGSANAFLQINDGIYDLAIADPLANEIVVSGAADQKAVLKLLLAAHPDKYKINKSDLVYIVSPTFEENYRALLGERATAMGDAYLSESRRSYYQGVEVYPVAQAATDKPVLTSWKNIAVGIGRDITREIERKPRFQHVEYTITAKMDFNYAVSEAITIGNG
jgi:hypothetical protein